MALACEDPFVRVYDQRKLSLTTPSSARHGGTQPLMELAPAHLATSEWGGVWGVGRPLRGAAALTFLLFFLINDGYVY